MDHEKIKSNKKNEIIFILCIIVIVFLYIIIFKLLSQSNNNFSGSKEIYSNKNAVISTGYSKTHICEYSGCSNYASGSKYCSKHNQKACSKIGCTNKEAYVGSGYCSKHLYESVQKYK